MSLKLIYILTKYVCLDQHFYKSHRKINNIEIVTDQVFVLTALSTEHRWHSVWLLCITLFLICMCQSDAHLVYCSLSKQL